MFSWSEKTYGGRGGKKAKEEVLLPSDCSGVLRRLTLLGPLGSRIVDHAVSHPGQDAALLWEKASVLF